MCQVTQGQHKERVMVLGKVTLVCRQRKGMGCMVKKKVSVLSCSSGFICDVWRRWRLQIRQETREKKTIYNGDNLACGDVVCEVYEKLDVMV